MLIPKSLVCTTLFRLSEDFFSVSILSFIKLKNLRDKLAFLNKHFLFLTSVLRASARGKYPRPWPYLKAH